jgi:methionyl-tRNA formyltransferase
MKKIKIFIITQKDSLVIPNNLQLLYDANFIEIIGGCVIKSKNSLSEKKVLFIKNFGIFQVFKMGFRIMYNKILNIFDSVFRFKVLKIKKSVKAFFVSKKLPFYVEKNVNNKNFISELKSLDLDLIVSFSAPTIFKSELLSLPKKGCINLHCSLLPRYSGILPSFWTLFNDETETGATVHYMDSEIDNGDILGQKSVEILKTDSMLDIVMRTKKIGGNLMVDVIYDIMTDNIKLLKNKVNYEKYHTWPTDLDFKKFAKKRNLI